MLWFRVTPRRVGSSGCVAVAVLLMLAGCRSQAPGRHVVATPTAKAVEGTPLEWEFSAGGCSIVVQQALGSTYRFDPSMRSDVAKAIEVAFGRCWSGKGTHGTAHLQGVVDSSGKVSGAVVSPGGALATDVARCLAARLDETTLAPSTSRSDLLLFATSTCHGP